MIADRDPVRHINDIKSTKPAQSTKHKRRLMHRSKWHHYSITSSAMESSPGGTSMPSARAA
jgi:hypothetical protein